MKSTNSSNIPNHNLPFSQEEVAKVLGSSAGRQLLQLLNRDGGQTLRQAANALQSGNFEQAKQILAPVMESEEASKLVKTLNEK